MDVMSLKDILTNKKELTDIITAFDGFTSIGPKMHDIEVQRLPEWMSLLDYFIANSAPSEDGYYFIHGKGELYEFKSRGNTSKTTSGPHNVLRIRIGDTALDHSMITTQSAEPFYMESLNLIKESREDDPEVTLHSGNVKYMAGRDFNEINEIGSVIYVGEDFFKGFMSKNRLKFDRNRYQVTSSQYELVITPKFGVTENNFTTAVDEIIGITNQVLKVLETKYSKQCVYFKTFNVQ